MLEFKEIKTHNGKLLFAKGTREFSGYTIIKNKSRTSDRYIVSAGNKILSTNAKLDTAIMLCNEFEKNFNY